jgi:hypothetical protein
MRPNHERAVEKADKQNKSTQARCINIFSFFFAIAHAPWDWGVGLGYRIHVRSLADENGWDTDGYH